MNTDTDTKAMHNESPQAQSKQSEMRWWQWLLVYPTLVVSLIGSIPTVIELYKSTVFGTPYGQSSIAAIQNEMWRKNLPCSAAPFDWYKNDSNIQVDGTICESGDVLVRVQAPNKKGNFWWVPVDGLIKESQNYIFFSNANAATLDKNLRLTQYSAQLLCQRFIADGRLLRRFITGLLGCFDEIVNTYTGQILSKNAAPCDPRC